MTELNVPQIIVDRRLASDRRIDELRTFLRQRTTDEQLKDSACVYATGSVSRGESSQHSDLDLFLVSRDTAFTKLDAIKVTAKLIEATEHLAFPPFSGDGEYLEVHRLPELLRRMGTRQDDSTNAFTARMLLLLESTPILGQSAYDGIIRSVIGAYWRDYADHVREFRPIFLTNDILRYWKVLCLSYESHGAPANDGEVAARRLRNYKLKHSRMVLCYSAIVYFCWLLRSQSSITPDDAFTMASMRPLERLERIGRQTDSAATKTSVQELLRLYSTFLAHTDAAKSELLERFHRQDYHAARRDEARAFGDEMFKLLTAVGADLPMFRYLLV